MRTEEQELAFANACLDIEKQGGDVLGYIAKEYPSYTPRPVWYRLQRDYLNRKVWQYTEGRPKKKGMDGMRKARGSMEQSAWALVECVQNGNDPKKCLDNLGYTNVNIALRNLKNWSRDKKPEWYEILKDVRLGKAAGRPMKTKKPEEKPETATSGGTEYMKLKPDKLINPPWPKSMDKTVGDVTAYVPKASPTCCQPASPSGVTVPDELPEEEQKTAKDAKLIYPIGEEDMIFIVKKMNSKLGTWEYNLEKELYIFQSYFYDDQQLNVLALTIVDWLNLAAEIPEAIKTLTRIIRRKEPNNGKDA